MGRRPCWLVVAALCILQCLQKLHQVAAGVEVLELDAVYLDPSERLFLHLHIGLDMDTRARSCGKVAGLNHDVPSVKVVVVHIMVQAHSIISGRLTRFDAARYTFSCGGTDIRQLEWTFLFVLVLALFLIRSKCWTSRTQRKIAWCHSQTRANF